MSKETYYSVKRDRVCADRGERKQEAQHVDKVAEVEEEVMPTILPVKIHTHGKEREDEGTVVVSEQPFVYQHHELGQANADDARCKAILVHLSHHTRHLDKVTNPSVFAPSENPPREPYRVLAQQLVWQVVPGNASTFPPHPCARGRQRTRRADGVVALC